MIFLSLPPKEIATTAKNKGYPILANEFLKPIIENLPEKSSMIGDKNWNPSDKFWTIKVSAKNLKYITKDKDSPFTLISGKMGKGEVTYMVPDKKPIGVKFTTTNQSKTRKITKQSDMRETVRRCTTHQKRTQRDVWGRTLNKMIPASGPQQVFLPA